MFRRAWPVLAGTVAAALLLYQWPQHPTAVGTVNHVPTAALGPANTAANDGYESPNRISPVVPSSYNTIVSPWAVGIQFLGDAKSSLKGDHFRIGIGNGAARAANVFHDGFVGIHLSRALPPGRYPITFDLPGFSIPSPHWTLTLKRPGSVVLTAPSASRDLLTALNTARSTLGLNRVPENHALDRASRAHAGYLKRYGFSAPSFHQESEDNAGFTGVHPWNRDRFFGWPTSEAGEVGMEWTQPTAEIAVVQDLIDTVYHRLSVLSAGLEAAGSGQTQGPHGAVVMDLGFAYPSNLPHAVVYPYNGQMGVPRGWYDIESPDPVGNGYGKEFGYPVTASFPTVSRLTKITARLWHGQVAVPTVVDRPPGGDMPNNAVGIVPRSRLAPHSLYTVDIRADATYYNGKVSPVRVTWEFSTGNASQSLLASPSGAHRLVVSDVVAGSGTAISREEVTLYRRGSSSGHLTLVAKGRTNDDGIWITKNLATLAPGYYEVLSGTNNAVVFQWGSD